MSLANRVRLGGVAAAFGGVFVMLSAIHLSLLALPASSWAARAFIGFAPDVLGVLVEVLFFDGRPSGAQRQRRTRIMCRVAHETS